MKASLEEEEEYRVSLEEKLDSLDESNDLIIAKIIKERDHAIAKYQVLKKKKVEFGVGNVQLQTQLSKIDASSSPTSSCNHANIIEENARLNDELAMLSSSISTVNDACATNSTSCEASILKENVELRAQLVLLTRKYGILEEIHEKLSSSNEDLITSHARLKLAHEATVPKVTSCEPHVDNGTNSTLNAILSCASPSDSSTQNVATSCDELLGLARGNIALIVEVVPLST